jgi:hypothetical protein
VTFSCIVNNSFFSQLGLSHSGLRIVENRNCGLFLKTLVFLFHNHETGDALCVMPLKILGPSIVCKRRFISNLMAPTAFFAIISLYKNSIA